MWEDVKTLTYSVENSRSVGWDEKQIQINSIQKKVENTRNFAKYNSILSMRL